MWTQRRRQKVCQIGLRTRRKGSGEGEKSGRISTLSSGQRGSLPPPSGGRPVWLGLRLVNHSAAASVAG